MPRVKSCCISAVLSRRAAVSLASAAAMVVSSAEAKAASVAEAVPVFEAEEYSALLVEQPLLEQEMAELFSFVDRVCRDLQNVFLLFFYMSFLFSSLPDFE
jgi:hypothetical protein